ncbi:MAG: transposase [Thermodesulfobacteriota bacterium]|nr:transposase [Thermodesulfobacteriota bacterium]
MPRQARLDAPGVLQHVMARGIERRKIFWDEKDRSSFLKRLAIILEETQTQCYAWALIPNHFHLLLRTGSTPLSKVMRRLMTGYAVTFNLRHRRAGHLFQNRYKSVVCEEETYLLELTRYIHLNPLRARLVEDLKSLDKYPWTGHSVLIGKQKNPLVPEIPPAIEEDKYLAEKTVEDVLRFFGKSLKESRRRYRQFVEKGIKQGRREDLQGGGLVRSAGGDKAVLLGQKKEDREKSDQRILGSGGFVGAVLQESERLLEKKYNPKRPIEELIEVVAGKLGLKPELICSGSRKPRISDARSIIAHMAVEETGHSATDVARYLGIKQTSVLRSVKKGRILSAGLGQDA